MMEIFRSSATPYCKTVADGLPCTLSVKNTWVLRRSRAPIAGARIRIRGRFFIRTDR